MCMYMYFRKGVYNHSSIIKFIQEIVNFCMISQMYITKLLWALLDLMQLFSAYRYGTSTVRAPVFGRHQFFGTSEHYGKAHGSLLSGWMNYNYTACCWFPASSNILILPSQFWQIRFESCWLHCSKCRILVFLWYLTLWTMQSITFKPDSRELWWKYWNIAGCKRPVITIIIIHLSRFSGLPWIFQ